jgi:hypothetical protein
VDLRMEPAVAERTGDEGRDLAFSGCSRRECRIDGVDLDQSRESV